MNFNDADTITDYITDKSVKNVGAEASRQIFEKFLVKNRGWSKKDIKVDEEIIVQFKGRDYISKIDLIVCCNEKAFMAITCVAGSIGSYEREILAGASLIYDYQIPFAVSTDAKNAVIMDTLTGKKYGQGLDAVFSKEQALTIVDALEYKTFDKNRKEREMLIYRSFNMEKINV